MTIAIALITIFNFYTLCIFDVYAHSSLLNVNYDDCGVEENTSQAGVAVSNNEGIDEMWYALIDEDSFCYHYDHEAYTIKYCFAESSDSGYKWTDDLSDVEAEEIKNAYANSMKKWNNVYFYSYNFDGTVTKNKVINVVEGSLAESNIIIYPDKGTNNIATTGVVSSSREIISTGDIKHYHYSKWKMTLYVDKFHVDNTNANIARERTGAHELGHVLGLRDIDSDNLCNTPLEGEHHNELLMGYSSPRALNITYKDIAGVAITRGFHTDDDHKWLNAGIQEDGTYKLICSICNGVKFVESLSGISYSTYGFCNNDHTMTSGNMMAVASYGNCDYYKCRYCRYVAPFDSNVTQNYSKTYHNSSLHKCVNNVNGLEYTFYEEHTRDTYVYIDNYNHSRSCACGTGAQTERHTVSVADIVGIGNFAPCMGCGYMIDLRDDYYNSIASITQVSVNGSYILPSGTVVLVDEDIQAYLDGTLVFYHPDNVPTTQ